MINVQYGQNTKVLRPFVGNSVIIQSFLAQYNKLFSIDLFFLLYKKCNPTYQIQIYIIDSQENIFYKENFNTKQLQKTGFHKIYTDVFLTKGKVYYLYISCLGNGNYHNKFSFVIGYRKKMEQLFIDGNSSLGQLYMILNYQE